MGWQGKRRLQMKANQSDWIIPGTCYCIHPIYNFTCRVWSACANELGDTTVVFKPKFFLTSVQIVDQFVLELEASDKSHPAGPLLEGI